MKMKVLSLCDGMSCGQIALEKAGIKVAEYYAAEIKEIGIKVTKENYPNTIHIGDVNKVSFKDGVLYTENGKFEVGKFDLVMFGSPCQTFSIACKTDKRIGLEDDMKSGLFLQCERILKEVNPRYFFMENVASMENADKDFITELLGVKPHKIDAKLVSPELRNRYYWTNIQPTTDIPIKDIELQQILSDGYSDRNKARNLLVSDSRPLTTPVKMFHRYYSTGFTTLIFKDEEHYKSCVEEYERLSGGKRKVKAKDLDNYTGDVFDGVRYLNQEELEKCQCVPPGYTKCLSRNDAADVLGDGWNIDVITYFFSFLPDEYKKEKENEMELRIEKITFPEVIDFNFEELKQEITNRVAMYANMVYTEDQVKQAKADRANLNKFVKALSDERTKVKKQCLKPYEEFEAKINELSKIVQEPIKMIDQQVKEYEEQKKRDKLDEITQFFNSTDRPEWLHIAQIMNEKWLNASVSMKSIQEEIISRCEQIENDIATLSNLPEFGFEATEVYKTTLDINKALNEGRRLSEIQKRKTEYEAEQARLKAEAELKKAEPQPQPAQEGFMNPPVEEAPVKQWVSFSALLSTEDAMALKNFFVSRGIEFKAV